MDLSKYKFPTTEGAFPTFNAPKDLIAEAETRDLTKARRKFNELFFSGGKVEFKEPIQGTWKEDAWKFCRAFMGSWEPKHEDKEAVCALLMDEIIIC